MKLFLIGLLGSGKSFLGKELAQLVKLPFIDLDEVLEKQEGKKVSEIFSNSGEAQFRKMEAKALRAQSNQKEFVMATGGGTPCFHDNMDFINQVGTSIFLNTPISEIVNRLNDEEIKTRPLLSTIPKEQLQPTLEGMLQNRLPFYSKAHVQIQGATITAKEILNLLGTKK